MYVIGRTSKIDKHAIIINSFHFRETIKINFFVNTYRFGFSSTSHGTDVLKPSTLHISTNASTEYGKMLNTLQLFIIITINLIHYTMLAGHPLASLQMLKVIKIFLRKYTG